MNWFTLAGLVHWLVHGVKPLNRDSDFLTWLGKGFSIIFILGVIGYQFSAIAFSIQGFQILATTNTTAVYFNATNNRTVYCDQNMNNMFNNYLYPLYILMFFGALWNVVFDTTMYLLEEGDNFMGFLFTLNTNFNGWFNGGFNILNNALLLAVYILQGLSYGNYVNLGSVAVCQPNFWNLYSFAIQYLFFFNSALLASAVVIGLTQHIELPMYEDPNTV